MSKAKDNFIDKDLNIMRKLLNHWLDFADSAGIESTERLTNLTETGTGMYTGQYTYR